MTSSYFRPLFQGLSIVAIAISIAGSQPASAQMKPRTTGVSAATVTATPLSSFERNGEQKARYGALEWRGGVVLTSQHPSFGGWSGLWIEPDGTSLLAVSDAGSWMRADLTYRGKAPTGLINAEIGPLLAKNGQPLSKNGDRDAEAMTLIDGTLKKGTALISFERNDRIGRFPVIDGEIGAPTGYLPLSPDAKRMKNEGFEALTVMRGGPYKGATLAVAENPLPGEAEHKGWIWVAGEPKAFTLKGLGEFGATDAVSLPDGTLLVLERHFSWLSGVRMRLRKIAADALKPGGVVEGDVLLDTNMSQEIDNMEGLAVVEKDGEAILTMISDDNFNHALQRTVLLQFAFPVRKKVAN